MRESRVPHHLQPHHLLPHHRQPRPNQFPALSTYHWPTLPAQVDRQIPIQKDNSFVQKETHRHHQISLPTTIQPARPHILDHHYDPNPKKPFKIYFEHFPSEWDSEALKWVFAQYGKVLDVYVPKKLTQKGDRFGFAEFEGGRQNEDSILDRVRGIWIGSYQLRANRARFSRKKVVLKQATRQAPVSISERVDNSSEKMIGVKKSSFKNIERVEHSSLKTEETNLRFVDIVKGKKGVPETEVVNQKYPSDVDEEKYLIDYQSLQEDREWLEGSAVGILWQNALIQEMRDFINIDDSIECFTTPMGGKMILLTFSSRDVMQKTLAMKPEWMSRWFERVEPWKAADVRMERYAWLKCEGLPLHAWNPGMLMMLGNLVGDAVSLDKNTAEKLRLDAARILIATSTAAKIDRIVNVAVDGIVYSINITEDPSDGPWCGRFQYAKNRPMKKSFDINSSSESETKEDLQTGRFDVLKDVSDDYYHVEVQTCIPNVINSTNGELGISDGGGVRTSVGRGVRISKDGGVRISDDHDRRSSTAGSKPTSISKFKSSHELGGKKVNLNLPIAVNPEGGETFQTKAAETASDTKSINVDLVRLNENIGKGPELCLRLALSPSSIIRGPDILPDIGPQASIERRPDVENIFEGGNRKVHSDPSGLTGKNNKRRIRRRKSEGSESNSNVSSFPSREESGCPAGYTSAIESGKRKKKQSFKRKLIRKKSKFPYSTLKYNLMLALMQRPTRRKIRRISNIMQGESEDNHVADISISDGGIENMNSQVKPDAIDSATSRSCENGSDHNSARRRRKREAKKTWKIGNKIGLIGKVCDLDIERSLELLIEREEREWKLASHNCN